MDLFIFSNLWFFNARVAAFFHFFFGGVRKWAGKVNVVLLLFERKMGSPSLLREKGDFLFKRPVWFEVGKSFRAGSGQVPGRSGWGLHLELNPFTWRSIKPGCPLCPGCIKSKPKETKAHFGSSPPPMKQTHMCQGQNHLFPNRIWLSREFGKISHVPLE